jgi:methionyl aminopeptidase
MILLKSAEEVATMRHCGTIVRTTIKAMADAIEPGKSTTQDLDEICAAVLREHGATASFKGYRGFPAHACISVNEEVVHGIPGPRVLEHGDIVTIDVGAFHSGFHGDAAWTYAVGEIDAEVQRLLNVTKESLLQGVAQAKAGNTVGDVANAVQTYVERNGFSVVRDLVGHGIGKSLHEDPSVPNFGKKGAGPKLREGMTICIEPMINEGKFHVHCLEDHWTIVTKDGKRSAHFEHLVHVTDGAPDILTPVIY